MAHIKVFDSPPGSGKTSFAIDLINKSSNDDRFFVITPLLTEVERFIKSCPNKNFIEPSYRAGTETKINHLIQLVSEGRNICSTHALLQKITDELITALRNNNYTLILDESFQVVNKYTLYNNSDTKSQDEQERLTRDDIEWLKSENYIKVNSDYLVEWVDDDRKVGNKYQPLYTLIRRNMLYLVRNSLFMWTFPYELFTEGIFKECYILTYLFKSQFQHYYYDYFGLKYDTLHIEKKGNIYVAVKTIDNDYELEFKKKARNLIRIVDDERLNKIGDITSDLRGRRTSTSLSMNWYKNNPTVLKKLNLNLINFFRYVAPSKSEKRLWTTFKDYQKKLKSPLATNKTFLSFTTRATNEYRERDVVAFMINRYPNQFYVEFFRQKNIIVNNDLYALSDLLQWLWRSSIRDDKPITLYLPSERMRNILVNYLNNNPINSQEYSDFDYEE
jgi:hypothetical protein